VFLEFRRHIVHPTKLSSWVVILCLVLVWSSFYTKIQKT